MHRFRFLDFLLNSLRESPSRKDTLANRWGVKPVQVYRDSYYAKAHLPDLEKNNPALKATIDLAAIVYEALECGYVVDLTVTPNDSQRIPNYMDRSTSPEDLDQNDDVSPIGLVEVNQ